jgi:ferredoxin
MTYVVTESCIRCRYTDCVEVCPTDCFRQGPNFLVIDPDECIDCGVCAPECPVDAIVSAEDIAEDQRAFVELNASLARQWPSIDTRQAPLPDAEDWKEVSAKLRYLQKEHVVC